MRNLFDRLNTLFTNWYEGLFGSTGELHPREVLRRLFAAAEEQRIEGLDGELYVPNRFKLEIALQNPEEQEAYLTFLQPQELADALWQEFQQEGYRVKGGVVCEVVAQQVPTVLSTRQALRITAKFDPTVPLPIVTVAPTHVPCEEQTNLASIPSGSTTDVAPGVADRAVLKSEDGSVMLSLGSRAVVIGRSRSAPCDLVLEADRQVSRRHARIEWDPVAGNHVIYDLQSTNGLFVNEQRVDNRVLRSGDRIRVGKTILLFETTVPTAPHQDINPPRETASRQVARLILYTGTPQQEAVALPQEALLGRALTADIVLEDPEVAMRHAVIRWNGARWQIEDLGSASGTFVNGVRLAPQRAVELRSGDEMRMGNVVMRLDIEDAP